MRRRRRRSLFVQMMGTTKVHEKKKELGLNQYGGLIDQRVVEVEVVEFVEVVVLARLLRRGTR